MSVAKHVKVETLEQQVLEGGKGLSAITELAKRSATTWEPETERTAARHSIRRSFTHLLDNKFLQTVPSQSAEENALTLWLKGEYETYLDFLNDTIWSDDSTISESLVAMRTLFWFCGKDLLVGKGENGGLRVSCVHNFISSALKQPTVPHHLLLSALKDEYLVKYVDFHRAYLRELCRLCKSLATSANWKTMYSLISLVPAKPGTEVMAPGSQEKHMKKPFQNAWLAFLALRPNNAKERRQVLALLPELIPHFPQPQLLCDFLTSCFSAGEEDEIPFIAFSSLFILVRDYQLDYPDLYLRLYKLLDTFRVESHPQFGMLMDACFKSSHLPLQLVASFAKKLGRIALLTTSPSTSVFALAFIYNLMRRNPSLVFLIHSAQTQQDKAGEMKANARRIALGLPALQAGGTGNQADPFNLKELDYEKSGAMESSLWEVESLKRHYCPSVSSFARSVFAHDLAKDRLTKPELPLDDFATTSQDLFIQEARIKQGGSGGEQKRLKVDAPLNVQKPNEDAFLSFILFKQ